LVINRLKNFKKIQSVPAVVKTFYFLMYLVPPLLQLNLVGSWVDSNFSSLILLIKEYELFIWFWS